MLEVTILSLLAGNLGWQAVVVSGWLRWRQIASRRQDQEEEEILTLFDSKENLASAQLPHRNGNGKVDSATHSGHVSTDSNLVGWEFKIVRASHDLFRNPAIFQKLCQEESMSGWIMLEKLDDRRVRFKRLIALRDVLDVSELSYDPYRCYYGSSFTPLTWISAIALLVAITIPSYFGYALVSNLLASTQAKGKSPITSPYGNIPPQNFPPSK